MASLLEPEVNAGMFTHVKPVSSCSGLSHISGRWIIGSLFRLGCWLGLMAGIGVAATAQAILVPSGAEWRYHNSNVNLGSTWRQAGYNDNDWSSGSAPLGAGDSHIVTSIGMGPSGGRYPTIYFRRTFSVSSAAAYEGLILRLLRDDGAAVYLNGTLLVADGVAIPSDHNQFATQIVDGANESTYFVYTAPAAALANGLNVLAVEVKQANATSSDLGFDLELVGLIDEDSPNLLEVQPSPGTVVLSLDFIRVIFDEGVTGIEAADLLLNGQPATGFTMISNREYGFTFPAVEPGLVEVTWAADHGITDDSPGTNPFVGGSWNYTVDPEAGDRPNVVISEFLAVNDNGIRDEDGTRSDWIEIHNLGPLEVSLEGWYLTDDPANPTSWQFPDVRLGVNEYLLVWASDKNRRDPSAPLHTNFRLGSDGDYLALLDAEGNVMSAFEPTYPPQQPDISYGRDRADPTRTGYYLTPTPGGPNTLSGAGFAAEPAFSLESGVYTNNTLTLTLTAAPGTTVRRTFDGSIPTPTSPLYTGPITFSTNMMIKVRAFSSDPTLFPSPVVSRTFVMLDASARNFTSSLPLLILSTPGRSIPQEVPPGLPRQPGVFVAIDTFHGRSSLQGAPDFQGLAEFEIFGQTSAGFSKRPHRIEIQDELRNDRSIPLLGMPADGDWKLRNPYSDKCLMNDFLALELFEEMGHYSMRRRLVEVFVSTSGGKLTYPRDYYGVMVLLENIERGSDRVNISRLTPEHVSEPEITGGYIWKKDKDSTGDLNFGTSGGGSFSGQFLKIHEPKPRYITSPQITWLRNHLNRMEQSLYAPNWRTATGTNHYSHYLDVDSLVDQHWIVEFTKQIDGYRLSNYMHKDRGGKIKMEPIWDWNLAFGNADYFEGGRTNGWYYSQLSENDHIWLRRLITGSTSSSGSAGDPEFLQKIADRWSVLRTNVFSSERLLNRIDELAAQLDEPAVRDFSRFPRLGSYVWPNPNGRAGGWHVDYVTPTTYAGIINELKRWVSGRYQWIDNQFTRPPQFSHSGGPITNESIVEISGPPGATIYYTLDGSDPRAPGGGVAPGALTYGSPLTVAENVHVFARARRNGAWNNTWSGPALLALRTDIPALRVTEIMYNPPPPPPDSPYGAPDFEYIELKNISSEPLPLNRFAFTRGIQFVFPSLTLTPAQRVVVVRNRAAFESRYGSEVLVAGEYEGLLDNLGERLTLTGPLGEPVHDFAYGGAWYPSADGLGFSLAIVDETASLDTWEFRSSWRPGSVLLGTPGRDDPEAPIFPRVRVNEVLSRPTAPALDAIELYNASDSAAAVGGWFLTDNLNVPQKFRIPEGTIIPPGGFLVFTEDEFSSNNPDVPFALSAQGEEVFVFSANVAGELTGYAHGFEFGAADSAVTFGRHITTTGEEQFVAQSADTLGGPNAGPRVGPVVLSEIMYHPEPVFANGAYWNNTEDEYVELYNLSPAPVPLDGWRLESGVRFDFPSDTSLPSGASLLVVSFDPSRQPEQSAAFRAKYEVPSDTVLFGPFDGNLNNAGETVALSKPDVAGEPASVSYILVDQAHYSSLPPWPASADGAGHALHRRQLTAYGNDPANWVGASPSPGRPLTLSDSDGDGLPDFWEQNYGLNPNDPSDASLDSDQDGMTNLEEYLAGTDPLDAESRLALEEITVAETITLRFIAAAQRGYLVQFKNALNEGSWETLTLIPAGAESRVETVIDSTPATARYYRLSVVWEP